MPGSSRGSRRSRRGERFPITHVMEPVLEGMEDFGPMILPPSSSSSSSSSSRHHRSRSPLGGGGGGGYASGGGGYSSSGGGGSGGQTSSIRSRRRLRHQQARAASFANLVALSAAIVLLANVAFPSTPAGAAVRRMAGAGFRGAREAAGRTSEWATGGSKKHTAGDAGADGAGGWTRGYGRSLGHAASDVGRLAHPNNADADGKPRRPIMHTFFHRIDPSNKGTAMSDSADRSLLESWRNAWYDAGYDPVVLTLDDAKRHPEYRRYAAKLSSVPMRGRGGKGVNELYNQLCFYRWLAMAVAGGGWMCDYDVFPLHPRQPQDTDETLSLLEGAADPSDPDSMPHGGDFTVYSISGPALPADGSPPKGVPALMSGRESEWTRMAINILEDSLHHAQPSGGGAEDITMWTDFFALMDVAGTYRTLNDVVMIQDVFRGQRVDPRDCDGLRSKRAVHLSHDSLGRGVLGEGERIEDRPRIAEAFLKEWWVTCVTGKKKAALPATQQQQPQGQGGASPLSQGGQNAAVERQRQAEAEAEAAASAQAQIAQQRQLSQKKADQQQRPQQAAEPPEAQKAQLQDKTPPAKQQAEGPSVRRGQPQGQNQVPPAQEVQQERRAQEQNTQAKGDNAPPQGKAPQGKAQDGKQ